VGIRTEKAEATADGPSAVCGAIWPSCLLRFHLWNKKRFEEEFPIGWWERFLFLIGLIFFLSKNHAEVTISWRRPKKWARLQKA
jgi:hypothetical protein